MSDLERLELLTKQMHLEPAEDCHHPSLSPKGQSAITVKTAALPNGQSIRLLKTLLSSYCENNCIYCPFRSQRDLPRASFKPDDFAHLFMNLHQAGFVEGIFLSSSIFQGAIKTQDLLLDTAAILRKRYQYQGYLHLKIMPGAEKDQVLQAMKLSDRLSINLEAPNSRALSYLAPSKDFETELLQPLHWIQEIRQTMSPHQAWNGKWPSSTTQFVVGAAGESDLDLLTTSENLYHREKISRTYFSSFTPIEDTPLENKPASPARREFRLYQASFLIRDYGYTIEDLVYQKSGNLPLDKDPKLAWAQQHLIERPIEINHAPKQSLLRIPSIGPARASSIINLRKQKKIRSFSILRKRNLISLQSAPYILIDGKSPAQQLQLF